MTNIKKNAALRKRQRTVNKLRCIWGQLSPYIARALDGPVFHQKNTNGCVVVASFGLLRLLGITGATEWMETYREMKKLHGNRGLVLEEFCDWLKRNRPEFPLLRVVTFAEALRIYTKTKQPFLYTGDNHCMIFLGIDKSKGDSIFLNSYGPFHSSAGFQIRGVRLTKRLALDCAVIVDPPQPNHDS